MKLRFFILVLFIIAALSGQSQYKYSVDAKPDKKVMVSIKRFFKRDKVYRQACQESREKRKDRKILDKHARKRRLDLQQKETAKRMKKNEKKAEQNNTGKGTIVTWFRKKEYNYRNSKKKK